MSIKLSVNMPTENSIIGMLEVLNGSSHHGFSFGL